MTGFKRAALLLLFQSSYAHRVMHHLVSRRKSRQLLHGADVDEPPRSDAGQDVVIQLPTDWAVLDGRDSMDDRGISHYEWSLVRGDTAISMKVRLSSLSDS